LKISDFFGQPPSGRHAGKRNKLADEVGLVGITTFRRNHRAVVSGQQPAGPIEPDNSGRGLRGQSDLTAKLARELAVAPTHVSSDLRDAGRS
jgi:hypothetical protein